MEPKSSKTDIISDSHSTIKYYFEYVYISCQTVVYYPTGRKFSLEFKFR